METKTMVGPLELVSKLATDDEVKIYRVSPAMREAKQRRNAQLRCRPKLWSVLLCDADRQLHGDCDIAENAKAWTALFIANSSLAHLLVIWH